ncbi:transcription repressor OFP8 [Phalaenopsis equestris]|uniref:transcription repressor OFP8 n=1 Tax=Phalaenopsis equestris TaxID=78828 RepID=UPI0009E19D66|nr:transcription repressor OFP8 [Phalaenopsis equestris]
MSSSSKRFFLRHPIVVDTGCSCRSSKLSSFLSLYSSQKQRTPKTPFFPSSSATTTTSPSDFSTDLPTAHQDSSFDDPQSSSPSPVNIPASGLREKKLGLKRKEAVQQSVAVVKESWNPYLDFRESLMVMIVEKELYSWDSLCELLHQFLSLNSPDHHHHILRAFAEVWNDIFSPFAASAAAGGGSGRGPL